MTILLFLYKITNFNAYSYCLHFQENQKVGLNNMGCVLPFEVSQCTDTVL